MNWSMGRRTLGEIARALDELELPVESTASSRREEGDLSQILETKRSRWAVWMGRLLAAMAAGVMVWDPLSIGRGNNSFALVAASSLQGFKGRLDDPRFPSGRTLSEAGLRLQGIERLSLPRVLPVDLSSNSASQVLRGDRRGREVSSGVHATLDGRMLVRTGISSSPPAFSCEIVDGHLLTTNSPMELDRSFLTSRTGPGRLAIANDGRWLVMERILPSRHGRGRAMLLLRQLRDISLAEKLAESVSQPRRTALL